jgi:hypothetical protein
VKATRPGIAGPWVAWAMALIMFLPPVAAGQSTSSGQGKAQATPSQPLPSQTAPPESRTTQPAPAQSEPAQSAPSQPNVQSGPDSRNSQPVQDAGSGQTVSDPQSQAPGPQKSSIQKPLGTAAAGIVSTPAVAASRPEGAALAPAKQRRVRLLVIKLGIVAAAAVALGTTVALSSASPGKPPGAH